MKENRFIELVNLYIDRQITAEETALLEAELQSNPRRRGTYRHYCQIHRATTQVYENFRSEEGGNHSQAVAGGARISGFESECTPKQTPWLYYSCGLAAACVALVFARVNYSADSSHLIAAKVAHVAVQSAAPALVEAPAAVAQGEEIERRSVSSGLRPNALVAEQDYVAMLAAMRREEQRAYASGQIQSGRASSLFQDGVFDSQTSVSGRSFHGKQSPSPQTEFAAFQFQR